MISTSKQNNKINFDLTEKDVNENFFDAKLVGSTSGLTEEKIGFYRICREVHEC